MPKRLPRNSAADRAAARRDANALAKQSGLSTEARRGLLSLLRDGVWPWPAGHPVGAVAECELIEQDWYPVELVTGFGAGTISGMECQALQHHLRPIARAARIGGAG